VVQIHSPRPILLGAGRETWVKLCTGHMGRRDFLAVLTPESPDQGIPDHNP
jgi:hypothetical protein